MKIQTSIVDLRALPSWPAGFVAARDIWRICDPQWGLRITLTKAMAPARIQVATLRHGLLFLSVVEDVTPPQADPAR